MTRKNKNELWNLTRMRLTTVLTILAGLTAARPSIAYAQSTIPQSVQTGDQPPYVSGFRPASRPTDWGPRLALAGSWFMYGRDGIANQIMGDPRSGHQADSVRFQMVFDKPPSVKVAFDDKGKKFLRLPFVVEKGKTAGKLVITTPEDTTGDFLIPACTPTTQSFDSPKLSLLISKFQDYPGDFRFNIQIESSPPDQHQLKIHDMDFFSDGSEHYIYGHIKLFGAMITNTEKEPLILRLSGDRYEYVSGKGVATTADGQALTFGN